MSTFDAEWRSRFERFARTYSQEHEVSGWSAEGLGRRFRLFERLLGELPIPTPAGVLELGCGAGTYVRYLAGLGHSVVGVDYALPSLHRALEADPGGKGRYIAADGYELPFVQRSFDVVVCIGVLQALSRPEQLLDEVARVLRPRGLLIVEALNGLGVPSLGRRAVEAMGGRPVRVRAYSPFEAPRWLEQRGLRLLRQAGVYLPPRWLPTLGRVFDSPAVTRLLERVPGGGLMLAHAFWLVGQKSA